MGLFSKKQKKVLIVDDEPLILKMTSEFLGDAGFETVTASSTSEALTEIEKGGVDAMLLDIRLPDEDGLVFLPKFKKLHPEIPVVMLTGAGYDDTMMKEALKLGAAGYVSKDTEMENMILAVKRVLK